MYVAISNTIGNNNLTATVTKLPNMCPKLL